MATGQFVLQLCNYNPLPSIFAFTGHMCVCICNVAQFFQMFVFFPHCFPTSPFTFRITLALRYWWVDSGKWENINLRLTPSGKVISHLSPTLPSCHVMRTASLSHSPPTGSMTGAISLTHSLIVLMEPMKSGRMTLVDETCAEVRWACPNRCDAQPEWMSTFVFNAEQEINPIQLHHKTFCSDFFPLQREHT